LSIFSASTPVGSTGSKTPSGGDIEDIVATVDFLGDALRDDGTIDYDSLNPDTVASEEFAASTNGRP